MSDGQTINAAKDRRLFGSYDCSSPLMKCKPGARDTSCAIIWTARESGILRHRRVKTSRRQSKCRASVLSDDHGAWFSIHHSGRRVAEIHCQNHSILLSICASA